MKKIYLIMLLLIATFSTATAETFTEGDLTFEIKIAATDSTYGQVICTGLTDAAKNVSNLSVWIKYIVSDGTYNYHVQAVGYEAFKGNSNIATAGISYGVDQIQSKAFYGCSGLKTVLIPSSITNLGAEAYAECDNIKSVFYACTDATTMLSTSGAFSSSSSRTLYVPWGSDLASYHKMPAFEPSYTPVVVHSSWAYDLQISNGALCAVTKAPTETTNGELTIIGFSTRGTAAGVSDGIFAPPFSSFTTNLHDKGFTYTAVADSAFYGNTDLTQIDFSNLKNIKTIGQDVAKGCTNLTSLSLKAGDVGARAFEGCTSLASVTLDSVSSISTYSFKGCTALTSISIPATATSVSPSFIDGCTGISSIAVASDNPNYSAFSGSLYNKEQTILYRVPEGCNTPTYTFPSTLTYIASLSFMDCANVAFVRPPYGLQGIGNYAFRGCSALNTVSLPSSVVSLGNGLFVFCSKLANVHVNTNFAPKIVKSSMFADASSTINLYTKRGMVDAFKTNGWTDFANYNLNDEVSSDLTTSSLSNGVAYSLSYSVTSSEPATINGTQYDGRVKVVRGLRYSSITGTCNIPNHVYLGDKKFAVTQIDTLAFSTSNEFTITGCANVDTVCYRAFYDQPLTSVVLPSVKCIEDGAFNKTNITAIDLPQGLVSIGGSAFERTLLDSVAVPDGVENIGARAFLYCRNMEKAVIGEGIDTLRYGTFYLCRSLGEVELPSTLKAVEYDLFYSTFITKLTVKATTPPVAADSNDPMRNFTKSDCVLYVPKGTKETYQATTLWSGFKDYVELEDDAVTGDINGDGIVDISDVNAVINMVLGKEVKTSAADVDGSGDIDISDVNTIINIMLGK